MFCFDCVFISDTMDGIDMSRQKVFNNSLKEIAEEFLRGIQADAAQKNEPTQFNAAFESHLLVLVTKE